MTFFQSLQNVISIYALAEIVMYSLIFTDFTNLHGVYLSLPAKARAWRKQKHMYSLVECSRLMILSP